jgi:hypothetical protein
LKGLGPKEKAPSYDWGLKRFVMVS